MKIDRKLAAKTFIQSQYMKALVASLRVGFCDEWKRLPDNQWRTRIQALKIRIQALKIRIQAFKIRIQALKIRIQAFKIRIQALKIRIQASKIRIQALKIRIQAFKIRIQAFKIRIQAFKIRIQVFMAETKQMKYFTNTETNQYQPRNISSMEGGGGKLSSLGFGLGGAGGITGAGGGGR